MGQGEVGLQVLPDDAVERCGLGSVPAVGLDMGARRRPGWRRGPPGSSLSGTGLCGHRRPLASRGASRSVSTSRTADSWGERMGEGARGEPELFPRPSSTEGSPRHATRSLDPSPIPRSSPRTASGSTPPVESSADPSVPGSIAHTAARPTGRTRAPQAPRSAARRRRALASPRVYSSRPTDPPDSLGSCAFPWPYTTIARLIRHCHISRRWGDHHHGLPRIRGNPTLSIGNGCKCTPTCSCFPGRRPLAVRGLRIFVTLMNGGIAWSHA